MKLRGMAGRFRRLERQLAAQPCPVCQAPPTGPIVITERRVSEVARELLDEDAPDPPPTHCRRCGKPLETRITAIRVMEVLIPDDDGEEDPDPPTGEATSP